MNGAGDNREIEALIDRQGDRVIRTAFMYLKNYSDAEDVFQMTFEKYLISRPEFESEEHEKAWFLRVAVNICKNLLSSGWKKKVIYDEAIIKNISEHIGADDAGTSENNEAVLRAVLELPQKLSVKVQLFYYEEYSVAQIAQILDISVGNVTTRLNRARKRLEKSLKEVQH